VNILLVHPGSTVSTADVFAGLHAGLKAHGANVISYALHGRIQDSERFLAVCHRRAMRQKLNTPAPQFIDIIYHACLGIFERILRFRIEAVVIVSGVILPKDTLEMLRRTGLPIGILMTETPYLLDSELKIAAYADFVWTHERSAVDQLAQVQANTKYLPHAWLPGVHDQLSDLDVKQHDVVFVGSDFQERIELLEGVDWRGIDLGLYGNWRSVKSRSKLQKFIRSHEIPNKMTTALYQQAKIGLNIYRGCEAPAESLNPRAYELAATGSFHLSTYRSEVAEKFGSLVPTFSTSMELQKQIRYWLKHDTERKAVAEQLPALVAEDTWIARGGQVLGDLRKLRTRAA
jgi:Uncharacterized protein conserved in bacteria